MLTYRQTQKLFWSTALILGAGQAWISRHAFDADGIAYVEIGEAYVRGDWSSAINGYWSPLYSWLLGVTLHWINPSPFWEFGTVHLLNFLIYFLSLLSFEFFTRELNRYNQDQWASNASTRDAPLTLPAWTLFGYSLFLASSIRLINLKSVSPDMIVSAVVFIAAGLLFRSLRTPTNLAPLILLGLTLGIGYLAKTAMFPIAFIFIGVVSCRKAPVKIFFARLLVVIVAFLFVSLPFIAMLSLSKGRLTFGDTGRLNYAWFVNKVPAYVHWQGQPPGSGIPVHTTKEIFDNPRIYEFATPIRSTYAPGYDPSYWYEGVAVHFDLRQQVRRCLSNTAKYAEILLSPPFVPILLFIVICFLANGSRGWFRDLVKSNKLILLGLSPLVMYWLVLVEGRYVSPFLVLSLLGIAWSMRRFTPGGFRSAQIPLAYSLFLLVTILTAAPLIRASIREFSDNQKDLHPQWEVAQGIMTLGLMPGDPVAVLGDSSYEYWARLARLRIIAEIPGSEEITFWRSPPHVKCQMMKSLAKSGAKYLVAKTAEDNQFTPQWQRIGNTEYYALRIVPNEDSSTEPTLLNDCF